jgi:hypothetical protein
MPGSRVDGYPVPSSSITMKQMLTLLLLTTVLNFALTHSQTLLGDLLWDGLMSMVGVFRRQVSGTMSAMGVFLRQFLTYFWIYV